MWVERVRIESSGFPRNDVYPYSIAALRQDQELRFTDPVSFFVGENGSGKSTLLAAIARRAGLYVNARSVRINEFVNPRERHLHPYLTLTYSHGMVPGAFFIAENFREFAEFLDDASAVDPGLLRHFGSQRITILSHGEGILSYFRNRYRLRGLYFLDEPETALSPASQLELLRLLRSVRTDGLAQFMIATHSPILMSLPEAQIFFMDENGIRETTLEDIPHYRLYRDFLADPVAFLAE